MHENNDYKVTYMIGKRHYTRIVTAWNESDAILKTINGLSVGDRERLHGFKIERCPEKYEKYKKWN